MECMKLFEHDQKMDKAVTYDQQYPSLKQIHCANEFFAQLSRHKNVQIHQRVLQSSIKNWRKLGYLIIIELIILFFTQTHCAINFFFLPILASSKKEFLDIFSR